MTTALWVVGVTAMVMLIVRYAIKTWFREKENHLETLLGKSKENNDE